MSHYDVCIIGGGPAGMLAALLLSERGRKVLVVEQHHDFSREYRGEVLMPRFTQMMRQVGLADWVETIPNVKIEGADFYFRNTKVGGLRFRDLDATVPAALWMPQTEMLNALHKRASGNPNYEIWFDAKPLSISESSGLAREVKIKKKDDEVTVSAKVIIGSDGRYSQVAKLLAFPLRYEEYRFDLLWFTIPRPKDYADSVTVLLNGKWNCLLLPKYPDLMQCGLLVAPRELGEIKKKGIGEIKKALTGISPIFNDFAADLKDFTPFHTLKAEMHYVEKWAREGVVLIGDSAHCCSPAGAIGVSVAAGTAIVAADVIHENLDKYPEVLPVEVLDQIQKKRETDVLNIHRIQKTLGRSLPFGSLLLRHLLPLALLVLTRTPLFRRAQRTLMIMPAPLPLSSLP